MHVEVTQYNMHKVNRLIHGRTVHVPISRNRCSNFWEYLRFDLKLTDTCSLFCARAVKIQRNT